MRDSCHAGVVSRRYLAHMYMAEAQVYLDRIADAIRNLNVDSVTDVSVTLPYDKNEQGVLYYMYNDEVVTA